MNLFENPTAAAELFRDFVIDVRKQHCGATTKIIQQPQAAEVDYDYLLPENHERAMKDAWNVRAKDWAGIESVPTYFGTMQALVLRIQRLRMTQKRKFRVLSLGAGPALYEIFLASLFNSINQPVVIYALDYAEKMVAFQKAILEDSKLRIGKSRVRGIKPGSVVPVTGDMSELGRYAGDIDLIICNNALQWVPAWKKVVDEMGKAMNPQGAQAAFLAVHPHAMRIVLEDLQIKRELITRDALFDEMQKAKFGPQWIRNIVGAPGSGQSTHGIDRYFIDFRFFPEGARDWREALPSFGGIGAVKVYG